MQQLISRIVAIISGLLKGNQKQTPISPGTTPPPVAPTPIPPISVGLDYQLSTHITFGMLTKTENRDFIDKNRALAQQYVERLAKLSNTIIEPAWDIVGQISINSGFRCPELNALIGGAPTSQHKDAEAVDMECVLSLSNMFNKLAFSKIPYSQIILEFNQWVHMGYIDETLHPGKVNQIFIATRQIIKPGEDGYDPANPTKTHTVYTPVTKPI